MPRINEDSYRLSDLLIKAGAAVAFIVPLAIGYFQSQRTADLESRKPYLIKQLDTCIAITDAAGTIATSSVPLRIADATETFDKLNWGSLAIFDNGPIADAVRAFSVAAGQQPRPDLRPLAERIAHRCKDLTRASWSIR